MPLAYPGDLLLHLASFVALAGRRRGRGVFELAARELNVDRSVLRRRIQTLADHMGVPILAGRGSELRPTAAGARLLERAQRLLAMAGDLRMDVTSARERIVIGCTGTITSQLMPRVIVELEQQVQLVVRRAGGAACEAMVHAGEVDLGVVRAEHAPRGLASRHLTDDRLWFVMPARHPLARRKPTPALMASIPLVLYGESSRTRARVLERLAPHAPTVRAEVEGRAAALEYVRAGIGATFLSLLPGHTVDATRVRARDVTLLFGPSRFYVIGRRERWHESRITDVVQRLCR